MGRISLADRKILQELAQQQYAYSQEESMQQLKKNWVLHNDCQFERPMVTVELGTFQQDVVPALLRCEGEFSRTIEAELHSNMVNHTLFHDDSVVKDHIAVSCPRHFKPFDLEVEIDHATNQDSLGHHFSEKIQDFSEDLHLFKKSTYGADRAQWENKLDLYHDLFDGIIPVTSPGFSLYAVPTQDLVHIMSMETMMFSMYDYPDEFKKVMDGLSNDYLAYFKFLQEQRLLKATVLDENLGQGTYCFTNDLPDAQALCGSVVTPKDIWGFLDSQETSGISPEMYEEFVFPYYKKIADGYGLLSYGCCEAVHPIWENCLSKLSNLRKVSISPWCDETYMGEQLKGKRIVYHRKPSPNYLGVGSVLDETGLRAHVRATLDAAKGCTIEFTQRDVYQLHNTYEKVQRYVEIIRDECAQHYVR